MQPVADAVPWERLVSSLPSGLQSVIQIDYDAWAEARRSPPPILRKEELDLMNYYQEMEENGAIGGVVLVLAAASILGRTPVQPFIDQWYSLREARRRRALVVPRESGKFKDAVEDRLTRLHELLKHFDADSLSPRLRVLRAQQERKRGLKRALADAWDLQKTEAIDEELRELAARKILLRHEVESVLRPQRLSNVASLAPAAAAGRRVLLHDISQSTWGSPPGSISVPCVNDVDSAIPPTLHFLSSELYGEGVSQPLTEVLIGCECVGDCRADRACKCVVEHDHREQPFDTYQAGNGRLTLRMWKSDTTRMIRECNMMCSCAANCRNKVVQRGPNVLVEVFKTKEKGWGVRSLQMIPKGTFVCTYVGEIITMEEFNRRNRMYQGHAETTYLYDLVFGLDRDEQRYMIDATGKGGVARFFNHSCDPNMENFQVFINDLDIHKPKVAFFANREVKPMEELTFDYKIESSDKSEKCCCGTANCRGLLL